MNMRMAIKLMMIAVIFVACNNATREDVSSSSLKAPDTVFTYVQYYNPKTQKPDYDNFVRITRDTMVTKMDTVNGTNYKQLARDTFYFMLAKDTLGNVIRDSVSKRKIYDVVPYVYIMKDYNRAYSR
jgi:hypothetical protein